MMRGAVVGGLLLGLWAGSVRAQEAGANIRAVITEQIEAFKVDDFETAFAFASPALREMFGSSSRFAEMVQNGYPMVWRPAQVRFSGLETRDGRMVQSVLVTDAEGALYVLDYDMIPGAHGAWRIDGVMVRRSGDAGA